MSYYCKGKDCPKKSDCARYKAYESFVNETGTDSAEGLWYVDEQSCVNNNYSEGVFPK